MSTDPNINKLLGNKLKEIRNKRKITREALAEKIDVSSRFLADVEVGKVGISLSTLKSICETLGVSSDILLGLKDDSENNDQLGEIFTRIEHLPEQYIPYISNIITTFANIINETEK